MTRVNAHSRATAREPVWLDPQRACGEQGLTLEADAKAQGLSLSSSVRGWCCGCAGQCHAERHLGGSHLAVYRAHRHAVFIAGLEVFLDAPEVAIDTNHLERALRPIPLGKRS